MRWQFITKYTNICYKHHNIHITVSKPAKMFKTVEKMNGNNNEGDNYKIAGDRPPFCQIAQSAKQWGHLVNRTGCHKGQVPGYSTEAIRIALAAWYIIGILF